MAREPLDTRVKIEQKPALDDGDLKDRGDVVFADPSVLADKEYTEQLAFNEEPVTIRINQSTEKHAANVVPAWSNGKGAEVFHNNRWHEITYLPTGQNLTVKRKIVEVLLRSKVDRINADWKKAHENAEPHNFYERVTSPAHSLSIVNDPNPRGAAWAEEIFRRNY